MLEGRGIDASRTRVSRNAVIMHRARRPRRCCRSAPCGDEIGTTRRGIGPAYADRAWRTGIRIHRPRPVGLRAKIDRVLPERTSDLEQMFRQQPSTLTSCTQRQSAGRDAATHDRWTPPTWSGRPARASTCCSKEPRTPGPRPRHLPLRDQQQRDRGRRLHRRRVGPLQVDQVIGVLKAYSSASAGAVSDRAGRSDRFHLLEKGASSGPRRASASVRLVRRGAAPTAWSQSTA